MRKTFIIIVLLGGCGDVSTPAAPGRPTTPTNPAPEPNDTAPMVVDLSCGESVISGQRIYFYAETEAPEWEFDVYHCTEPSNPIAAPMCSVTTDYFVDEGMLRIPCGEWEVGAETADYVTDFVRVEEKVAE